MLHSCKKNRSELFNENVVFTEMMYLMESSNVLIGLSFL